MILGRPEIDLLSPVNRAYWLVGRRRHWFMALPNDAGTTWRDLSRNQGGATLSYAPLARTDRPGGWKHVPTSGSTIACTTTVNGGGGAGMTIAKSIRADSVSGGYHCIWRAPSWGNSSFYRNGNIAGFYNDSDTLVGASEVVVGWWDRWLISASGNGGSGGTVSVYRNGRLVGTAALGSLVFTNFNESTITLGGDAFSQYFQGALDDLDVYPWALSEAEARADYLQSGGSYPDGLNRLSQLPVVALIAGGAGPDPDPIPAVYGSFQSTGPMGFGMRSL